MGNNICCCRSSASKFVEGSTQTLNNYYNETTIQSTEETITLSEKKNIIGSNEENSLKHRRLKSEIPSKNENNCYKTSLYNNLNSITVLTKNGNLTVPTIASKPSHQKTSSFSINKDRDEDEVIPINEFKQDKNKEKPIKKITFKDKEDSEQKKEKNLKKIIFQSKNQENELKKLSIQNENIKENFELVNKKKITIEIFNTSQETDEQTRKKLTFQVNNEKDEPLDRQRSRTNFAKKNITDNNKFDSKNIVRSQSWDTGKTYIESQSKEIDEMFEYLENFQSLHLNEKIKSSLSQDKNDLLGQFEDEGLKEESDSDDSDSSEEDEDNKEETDLGEIADVEKYVARRISKSNLPGESDEKTKYDISPKMKKILGKFYHNEKNQLNLFSDCVNKESTSDINPLDLKTESSDGKKLISSNSKKISNSNFKKTVKLTKLEPKLIRRKSEKDIAKTLEDNLKIKKLLEELQLFNRYGSNFTVKVSNGRPLIKTGGGFITLENYLDRVLNKLAKKNLKNQPQIPKINLDPGLVQKLSEYLVSLSDKNETETKTTGGGFLTARVQRRPTGWMVKNKKAQQEKKDLKIDEKISVQLVSPNRGFKF